MPSMRQLLDDAVCRALGAAGVPEPRAIIQTAGKPEFGHYQANGVMPAAKALGEVPRQLAERVAAALPADGLLARVEVAGPGFLNLWLDDNFLAGRLNQGALLEPVTTPQTVVVDYSAPNLAKEMHVGHLRSTIIGDAIARVLGALGHSVIRQNHVGDWGTQFGMLVTYLAETGANSEALADLEDYYRAAKRRFDEDAAFAERARDAVVALQGGDPDILAQWRRFIDISMSHCEAVYERLGVLLTRQDIHGESAYNDDLEPTLADLEAAGLLSESDGARVVFLDEFKRKDGEPLPVIVQKSGGGFLYATTDLAALRYRTGTLKADQILYLVDARQSLHFQQVFTVARKAGFVPEAVRLAHLPFGAMLGADGKPFKTRAGDTVKLIELLNEAEERAAAVVADKNPELDGDTRAQVARLVGIGAVKYADLSKNRTNDYVFDWDQMLAFEGNTAPYLQYAYTRVRSIFRRAALDPDTFTAPVVLGGEGPEAAAERELALAVLRFPEAVEQVAAEGTPHVLCSQLFSTAQQFMRFYEACPILKAEPAVRDSRLALCQHTARVLREGLALLGIGTVEAM